MAKELTPEEKIAALEAENKTLKSDISELKAENKKLKAENLKVSKDLAKASNEVPGTFKTEDGTVVKFKKGFLKFLYQGKSVISEEVIKDDKIMNHLVEIGFGGIEIVEPSK